MTQNKFYSSLEKAVIFSDNKLAQLAQNVSPHFDRDNSITRGALNLYAFLAPSFYAATHFGPLAAGVSVFASYALVTASATTTSEDHHHYKKVEPSAQIPEHLLRSRRDFAQAIIVLGSATAAMSIAKLAGAGERIDGPLVLTSAMLAAASTYYFTPKYDGNSQRKDSPSHSD